MSNRNILDFRAQADHMLDILEGRLALGQRDSAQELLMLKFKVLYEQGVVGGRLYETSGVFPFTSVTEE